MDVIKFKNVFIQKRIIIHTIVLLLILPFLFHNIRNLYISFKTGEIHDTIPSPYYKFLPVKSDKSDYKYITFGIDFSEKYINGKHFNNDNLYTNFYLEGNRPSLYPPLILYIFSKTLSNYPYHISIFIHFAFQTTLFLITVAIILRRFKLSELIPITLTLIISLLYLTPIGLSWFERGQFELYPALALIFTFWGIIEKKPLLIVIAGLFASIKWTILPFLIQLLTIQSFTSFKISELKNLLLFLCIIFASLLIFPSKSLHFIENLYKTQSTEISGFTLAHYFSLKSLIIFLFLTIILYTLIINIFKLKNLTIKSLPFYMALYIFNLLIPSLSWEYRIVGFIGFLPILMIWHKLSIHSELKVVLHSTFIIFIIISFRILPEYISNKITNQLMLSIYLIFSLAFTIIFLIQTIQNHKQINNKL